MLYIIGSCTKLQSTTVHGCFRENAIKNYVPPTVNGKMVKWKKNVLYLTQNVEKSRALECKAIIHCAPYQSGFAALIIAQGSHLRIM